MQVIDQTMRDYHNKNKEAAENNQRQSAVRKCIRSKSCQFYVLFRSKKNNFDFRKEEWKICSIAIPEQITEKHIKEIGRAGNFSLWSNAVLRSQVEIPWFTNAVAYETGRNKKKVILQII